MILLFVGYVVVFIYGIQPNPVQSILDEGVQIYSNKEPSPCLMGQKNLLIRMASNIYNYLLQREVQVTI